MKFINDYLFCETSARFRQLPMVDNATKNDAISFWKKNLNAVKDYMMQILINKGVRIVSYKANFG